MDGADDHWNHNLHYHPVVISAIPAGCQRALDVGCGEGTLTRQIRALVPGVTGIDRDQPSIDLARTHPGAGDISYQRGDFLSHPFEPGSYDFISSVASLHHMDAASALGRMRALLRPGGVLAVIGLARPSYPADLPAELAGFITHRYHLLRRSFWEQPSPTVWPPPDSFKATRALAATVLPGVRYRRHLLWRYTLTWVKPHG
ncbi:MAG: class I SAM-dependent methyltransferase [Streptosporangiaceae bacterium]